MGDNVPPELEKRRSLLSLLSNRRRAATTTLDKKDIVASTPPIVRRQNSYENAYKICFVGTSCGKTTLIHRFLNREFKDSFPPTTEEYHKLRLPLGPEKMESDVVLLDTSGDKSQQELHLKWWKWADAFVFVYAITDLFSFQQLEDFYREITTCRGPESFTMTVLGIRADLSQNRIVSSSDALAWAEKYKSSLAEVSALTGDGVNHMLEPLIETVGQRKSFFRKHAWSRSSGKHSPISPPMSPESPRGPPRRAPPPPPPQENDPFVAEMNQIDVHISELENLKSTIQRRITELNAQKNDAVELEEYDVAKKCKLEIESMEEQLPTVQEQIDRLKKHKQDKITAKEEERSNRTRNINALINGQLLLANDTIRKERASTMSDRLGQKTFLTPESPRMARPTPPKRAPPPPPPPESNESSQTYRERCKSLKIQLELEKRKLITLQTEANREELKKQADLVNDMTEKYKITTRQLYTSEMREIDPDKFMNPEFEISAKKIQRVVRGFLARKEYRRILKLHRHRTKVVQEILATEIHYVSSLKQIVKLYLEPLRIKSQEDKTITVLQIKSIFSDIEAIMNANISLLSGLDNKMGKWSPYQMIGTVFLQMVPVLRIYTNYVKNYSQAVDSLNTLNKNNSYISFLQAHDFSKDHLESLLIQPIQRIPRYSLLLEDLVKNTWREHPDYDDLSDALHSIKGEANIMNEKRRESENIVKVFEISSKLIGEKIPVLIEAQRRFVREGPVSVISKKVQKPRYLFLFTDLLLVTSKKEKKSGTIRGGNVNEKYKFLTYMSLEDADIVQYEDQENIVNSFSITNKNESFWFSCVDENSKKEWVSELTKVLSKLQTRMNSINEHSMKVASEKSRNVKAILGQKYASLKESPTIEKVQ